MSELAVVAPPTASLPRWCRVCDVKWKGGPVCWCCGNLSGASWNDEREEWQAALDRDDEFTGACVECGNDDPLAGHRKCLDCLERFGE